MCRMFILLKSTSRIQTAIVKRRISCSTLGRIDTQAITSLMRTHASSMYIAQYIYYLLRNALCQVIFVLSVCNAIDNWFFYLSCANQCRTGKINPKKHLPHSKWFQMLLRMHPLRRHFQFSGKSFSVVLVVFVAVVVDNLHKQFQRDANHCCYYFDYLNHIHKFHRYTPDIYWHALRHERHVIRPKCLQSKSQIANSVNQLDTDQHQH